ncbi:MAG: rRNA maturation RNase YbeY [Rubrivivax sp.]|nr:rRNA maturation RNase YbeY [Rubrivivax sp.]
MAGAASAAAGGAAGRAPTRVPSLVLSLQFADARHKALLPRHRVARWVRAALQADAQITVRIVGGEEGRSLNRSYRGKDYATNVLTFDYQREPLVVADLVLCAPVLAAEAKAAGIGVQAHYAHLLVHGTLHAQGYDHRRAAEARRMERRESELLVALGFADPYAR